MPKFTSNTEFEEELKTALGTTPPTDIVPGGETGPIVLAAIADSQAPSEETISVALDIQITTTKQWAVAFKEAGPSARAVMLSQVMDLFNDGQEGIFISFSEPKLG